MASIKVKQNVRRECPDEQYPLYLQVLHARRKKVIYLGIRVPVRCFDPVAQRVLPVPDLLAISAARRANDLIDRTVDRLERRLETLDSTGSAYSIEDLCDGIEVRTKPETQDLFVFFRHQIRLKERTNRFSSAKLYTAVLRSLCRYTQGRSCPFGRLSERFVAGYAEFLREQGLAAGSIAKYFDVFRTVCMRAAATGISVQKDRIFARVRVHAGKTEKRAVRKQFLSRIACLPLEGEPALDYARDLFLFSFYARGISFVDILRLTHKNLRNGKLEYFRAKSGTHIAMSITPQMAQILKKYAVPDPEAYLFPTLRGVPAVEELRYRTYRTALKGTNRALAVIARRADIGTRLTTYVARHSWATCAKEEHVPIPVIKEALGHASIRTTEIYLREFDLEIIDRVNERITRL